MAGEDNRAPVEIETGFELERFEFVTGTGMHALVRVRGRWARALDPAAGAPQLVADLPGRRQRFAPLDPREAATFDPAGRDPWRSAYAVPAALLERPEVAYAIDGPGGLTELPAPGEHAPGRQLADLPGALAELRAAAERASTERDEARARVEAVEAELASARETRERLDEASRRADSLAKQLAVGDARTAELQTLLDRARSEADAGQATIAELTRRIEELERQARQAKTEAEAARAELTAQLDQSRLEGDLRVAELAARLQDEALELEQARAGVVAADAELAAARELVERLQRELEVARR